MNPRTPDPLRPEAGAVGEMFSGITARYDLLNRLMSLGLDQSWRREAVRLAALPPGGRVLDLCCGTGDLSLELARAPARPAVVGLDVSAGMLRRGREKSRGEGGAISFVRADALRLPFADGSFDAATVAFGLRNIADREAAVREVIRVLKPGGRFVVLEFSQPGGALLRGAYHRYLAIVPPLLARLLRVDAGAYRYLAETVRAFPPAEALAALLARAGLNEVRCRRRFLGTVALHAGRR